MASEGKIKIQCSECGQQFDIDPELMGRLVECGECQHHFHVDSSCILKQSMRHYPGEKVGDLSMFSKKIPEMETSGPVGFRTVAYEQQVDPNDVMPLGAKRLVCIFAGIIVALVVVLIFVFGNDPAKRAGLMLDVGNDKRYILCGFAALISSMLLIYGFRKKRLAGVILSLLIAGGLLSLPTFYPAYFSPASNQEIAAPQDQPDQELDERKSQLRYKSSIGYGPVETAIANYGADSVVAIVLLESRLEFLDTVKSYLSEGLQAQAMPKDFAGSSRNVDGRKVDLVLYTNIGVSFDEAAEVCQGFGKVVNQYPELRVIEVEVNPSDLVTRKASILSDENSIDFYNANYKELSHIDPERQLAAIRRLGAAKQVGRRADVVNLLLRRLSEDSYPYKVDIVKTLMNWTMPEDNAGAVVKKVADKVVELNLPMPDIYVEYLIEHNEPKIGDILIYTWKKDPAVSEPMMVRGGERSEMALVEALPRLEKKYMKSAANILRRIGTKSSVPALQEMLERADESAKPAIETAIDAMKTRG
ncbi:hypothetical protein Rhal01_00670 [Rubritalea halochordaticola]|uniref:HEAT repeat domain-containing protein n=1 Tax=Rubritalea halochordaticola TaxID=714537 RepID=A0ABP9UVM2_9BACT